MDIVRERQFVLDHIAQISDFGVDPDLVAAILAGAENFAVGAWAPLRRVGDILGAKWVSGSVKMPAGFPDAYRGFVEGGWGAVGASDEFGGMGLPAVLQAAVLDALGTANMPLALCPILTLGAVDALAHHGNDVQQKTFLPRLVSGEWTGTMNLTEPQAGSDVGALRTTAEPLPSGLWSITGQKIFISYGDHDLTQNIVHLVLARTPEAPAGTRGLSLFLVPKFRQGEEGDFSVSNDVRAVSIEHKMGIHASPTCVMTFGEAGDCQGELVGELGGGMRAMFTMMNNARLCVALQGVQIAEAATQAASRFARERIQGRRCGAPAAIIEYPDVRRMMLTMMAQTQAARALVYYAFAQIDRAAKAEAGAADRAALLTPIAKSHATDLGSLVASLGIQIFGGAGYIEESGMPQLLRDARITAIYEGTNGIQAADLVVRKLTIGEDGALARLLREFRVDAEHPELNRLLECCETLAHRLAAAREDDRLGASAAFLQMLAVAIAGTLLERGARRAPDDDFGEMKRTVAAFYLDRIVPEAMGLAAAAEASSDLLYALTADQLAA